MEVVMQQTNNTRTALAVIVTLVLLLAAQATFARNTQTYPRALSMDQVELIGLDANMCMLGIREEMSEAGFLVTDNLQVPDAILEVRVRTNGSLHDHAKIENVHYSAVLVGAGDHVFVADGGYEGASNLEEVCEDIGDDIADAIEDRMA
jgi:hypothetical protein